MSLFSFKHLHVENFRCFDGLDLSLEGDLTVSFAEKRRWEVRTPHRACDGTRRYPKREPQRYEAERCA
jgi:hypothetical protein